MIQNLVSLISTTLRALKAAIPHKRSGRSMRWIRCLLVAAVLCGGMCTVAEEVDLAPVEGLRDVRPGLIALENGRIVVRPGTVLERGTVLIQDDRILAVGTDLPVPASAKRIDLTGHVIYPGFVDAFGEVKLELPASAGGYWNPHVTPQRSVIADGKKIPPMEVWRRQGFVARLLAPEGGQIKGTSALVSTDDGERNNRVWQPRVAMHASLTAPWSWEPKADYPGSPMGALTLVRQALLDANWYRDAWRVARSGSTAEVPPTNIALAALVEALDDDLPWIIDASNEKYFQRADRMGREFALRVIVHGSGEEYRRLNDVVATRRAVILPVNFPAAPDVSTQEAALSVGLERLYHWDLAPENPGRLARAGVPIAFTTRGLKAPAEFWPALRRAILRGLSPDAALAALSINPCTWFGVSHCLGTVEPDKFACLTVANGDLFDVRLKPAAKITEVWIRGQRYELELHDRRDVRGEWKLELTTPGNPQHQEWTLKIQGTPDRLRAQISQGELKAKVQSLQWDQSHMTCMIDTQPWKQNGWLQATFVIIQELHGVTHSGRATWPGGDSTELKLTYLRDVSPDVPPEKTNDEDTDKRQQEATVDPPQSEIESSDDEETTESEGPPSAAGTEITSALFDVVVPLGAYGLEQPITAPSSLYFHGGTIWTCAASGKLERGNLLVQDGRIAYVGAEEPPLPEGCQRIDCQGKHLTPGIIDCHSHIATDGGLNESTQAITAEVRIADFLDADDITIYRQLAGGVTTANVLHGSANPIGGQNQVIKLRWGASHEGLKFREAPPGVKFALGENVKQSNWGDRFTTRYPQTRMGVDEIIDDAFRRAEEYARRHAEWNQDRRGLPPRRDLELEALSEVLAGTRWVHCHSYRQSEILALMHTCERYGVLIGTFQHILEGYKLADEMARRGIMGSAFSDWWAYKFEVYDAIPYAGALMHEAGVVVSFNSDDHELGRRLNLEATKAVKYGGVSPEEALQFVTLNPARQLRIDRHVGSLEPGKHADLAIWSGDPLSVTSRCEQTWIEGVPYFDRSTSQSLEARDRLRHAALVQRVLQSGAEQIKSVDEPERAEDLWPRADTFCHEHP